MRVSGKNCFSCHRSMDELGRGASRPSGATFHEAYDETTDCQSCHNSTPGAAAPGLVMVTDFHNGLETANVGIIEDGEDTSIELGKLFTWQITSVTDNATTGNMTVTWTATYNGARVDPCNSDGAAGPVFVPTSPADAATTTGSRACCDLHARQRLRPRPGHQRAGPADQRQHHHLDRRQDHDVYHCRNTTCASNVATTTITRGTVPAGATVGIVALQGKPALPLPSNVDHGGVSVHLHVCPRSDPDLPVRRGHGRTRQSSRACSVARSSIVDKCTKCHVGSLYQHGNTRVDNTLMCTVCHNSASSEQSVRYGMGVDASEAYDGLIGQTFELKTMLHRIHTAGGQTEAAPFVIYRTRGIFAWAPEGAVIPNWPTASTPECQPGKYQVYGALRIQQVPRGQPQFVPDVQPSGHRPIRGTFNDCTACHTTGSVDDTPNQSEAVATTFDAGSTVWQNQIDDTLQGASAAACTSCHTGTDAKGHAYQNGWVPQTFEDGRQTIIDTN